MTWSQTELNQWVDILIIDWLIDWLTDCQAVLQHIGTKRPVNTVLSENIKAWLCNNFMVKPCPDTYYDQHSTHNDLDTPRSSNPLFRLIERESCDTDVLTRLVNASGSPPDSEPFRQELKLEVQYVSRGTYRLFNKTQDQMPFIYFELPREASILRASGVYDATTVRDDSTLRADLIRTNSSTWILHVNGEMLRCPGWRMTSLTFLLLFGWNALGPCLVMRDLVTWPINFTLFEGMIALSSCSSRGLTRKYARFT